MRPMRRGSRTGLGKGCIVDKEQRWFFTFGSDQPYFGCYHVVSGDEETAREIMNKRFYGLWSMCYSEERWEETNQVVKYGLKELK